MSPSAILEYQGRPGPGCAPQLIRAIFLDMFVGPGRIEPSYSSLRAMATPVPRAPPMNAQTTPRHHRRSARAAADDASWGAGSSQESTQTLPPQRVKLPRFRGHFAILLSTGW